VRARSSSL